MYPLATKDLIVADFSIVTNLSDEMDLSTLDSEVRDVS
jgi:hypothetical protein